MKDSPAFLKFFLMGNIANPIILPFESQCSSFKVVILLKSQCSWDEKKNKVLFRGPQLTHKVTSLSL